MKEQIEEALKELEFDRNEYTVKGSLKTCQFVLTNKSIKKITNCILALIPNNDWLEYPKNKPDVIFGQPFYVVHLKDGDIRTDKWSNMDTVGWLRFGTDSVIAFKPTPVEPYVKPKNKYVEVLEQISNYDTDYLYKFDKKTIECLQELKAKIENGDLK